MARDVEFDVTANDKTGSALTAAERHFEESQKRIDKINKDHSVKRQKDLDESAAKIGRRLETVFGKAAPKLAQSLASSFESAGPAIGAAAAALAPFIGANISAAIIGGAGGLGVIGGVILASRDPRVAAAGTTLGKTLLSSLEGDATPFIEPVLKAIDTVENRFQQLNGRISSIFSHSSGFLAPLVDGALDGIQGILRGFDALVRRSGPVIDVIATGFGQLGNDIGDAFEIISGGSEDAATAFEMFFKGVGATIKVIAYLIRGLTELYGVISYIPGKAIEASEALGRMVGIGNEQVDTSIRATDATAGLVNKIGGLGYAYAVSGEAMDRTNQYLTDSETAMAGAAQAARDLITANHTLYDSETNLGAAVAAATKARKENGRTLDANTEKGRANRAALSAVASAAQAEYEAFTRVNGEGPKSVAVGEKLRAKFIKTAEAFGAGKTEANNLANSIINIPSKKDVKIEAKSNAATISRETKDALNSIHSKTVSVTVNVNASRLASVERRLNALGGSNFAAGGTWAALDGNSGVARTGGPSEVNVNNAVSVSLDGAPFYAITVQAARERSERDAWRQKVGRI